MWVQRIRTEHKNLLNLNFKPLSPLASGIKKIDINGKAKKCGWSS